MKITRVIKEGDNYTLVYTPSFFGRFFGKRTKEITYRFDPEGRVYTASKTLKAVIRQDGEIMNFTSEEVKIINNYLRSF